MKVASVRRRLAAASIDGLIAIILVAAWMTALIMIYGRRDGEPVVPPWLVRLQRFGPLFETLSLAEAISARNLRSPGRRIAGIRAVERADGGPVSVRSAAIRHAARNAIKVFARALARPERARWEARMKTLHARMQDLRQEAPDDPVTRAQAAEYGRAAGGGCLRAVAPVALLMATSELPALWSSAHQTLPERLAGIVIVEA